MCVCVCLYVCVVAFVWLCLGFDGLAGETWSSLQHTLHPGRLLSTSQRRRRVKGALCV